MALKYIRSQRRKKDSKPTKPIILKKHFKNIDTIVYEGYIQNGIKFCEISNIESIRESVFNNEISVKQWQKLLDAIEANKGDSNTSEYLGWFAVKYCKVVGHIDEYMRQAVLNSNNPRLAIRWCRDINDDPQMRQIVLEAKESAMWAFLFCLQILNHEEIKQVIIDKKDPKFACYYCQDISNDPDMRQVIIDSGDPDWAYEYCKKVSNDADMRKIITNSKDFYLTQ